MTALRLGVNVDHVATVRNARGGALPDPVRAALLAIEAGADGITAHLREDRRHIHDDDMRRLKAAITKPLNFEMAATEPMLDIALRIQPHACCLVPEKRTERTTEGGLDVVGGSRVAEALRRRTRQGRHPRLDVHRAVDRGAEGQRRLGAPVVELHTGAWCDALEHGDARPRRLRIRPPAGRRGADRRPRARMPRRPRPRLRYRARHLRPAARSSSSTSAISSSARRSSSASPRACSACARRWTRGGRPRRAPVIIGIGSDLCDIRRIEADARAATASGSSSAASPRSSGAGPTRRAGRAASYAKRFAAKEACAKALGTGPEARRVLARHGGRQPALGPADDAPDRRRGRAPRRRSAARDRGVHPPDDHRRAAARPGVRGHRGAAGDVRG